MTDAPNIGPDALDPEAVEPEPSDPEAFNPEGYSRAAAPLLGLRLEPDWIGPVAANLRVLAAAADLVAGFPLPDEAEAAPRFEA